MSDVAPGCWQVLISLALELRRLETERRTPGRLDRVMRRNRSFVEIGS